MKANSVYIVSLLLFGFVSCNRNEIYNSYLPVEKNQWFVDDRKEFTVEILDTLSKNNVFINIRNTNDYPYSSLFLISKIEFPSGLQIIDTLEYEMTDAEGQWLGSGLSSIKENKLFLKENVVFTEKGAYLFKIQQATRGINDIYGENPLLGISHVGVSIEKN